MDFGFTSQCATLAIKAALDLDEDSKETSKEKLKEAYVSATWWALQASKMAPPDHQGGFQKYALMCLERGETFADVEKKQKVKKEEMPVAKLTQLEIDVLRGMW